MCAYLGCMNICCDVYPGCSRLKVSPFPLLLPFLCFSQMLFTQLGHYNTRLLATGGMCPDNSDALYANDFPKGYSRTELIQHGKWITKKEIAKEKAHAAEAVHHHFS